MSLADDITPTPTIDDDSDTEAPPAKPSEVAAAAATDGNRRRTLIGRAMYVMAMALAVGGLGYPLGRADTIHRYERKFMSDAEDAQQRFYAFLNDLEKATEIMAVKAGATFPNASDWPNVWIDRFQETAADFLPPKPNQHSTDETVKYLHPEIALFLVPLVKLEQAQEFEEFAVGKHNGDPGQVPYIWTAPQDTVEESSWSGGDYVLPRAVSDDGSTNEEVVAPILQASPGLEYFELMDFYGSPETKQTIDDMLECLEKNNERDQKFDCRALGSMVALPIEGWVEWMDGSLMMAIPVFPDNDPLTPVGLVVGAVEYRTLLKVIGASSGLDIGFNTWNEDYNWRTDPIEEQFEGGGYFSRCKEGGFYMHPWTGLTSCEGTNDGEWGINMVGEYALQAEPFYIHGPRIVSALWNFRPAYHKSEHYDGRFIESREHRTFQIGAGEYYKELNAQPPRGLWIALTYVGIIVGTSVIYFVASDRCGSGKKK